MATCSPGPARHILPERSSSACRRAKIVAGVMRASSIPCRVPPMARERFACCVCKFSTSVPKFEDFALAGFFNHANRHAVFAGLLGQRIELRVQLRQGLLCLGQRFGASSACSCSKNCEACAKACSSCSRFLSSRRIPANTRSATRPVWRPCTPSSRASLENGRHAVFGQVEDFVIKLPEVDHLPFALGLQARRRLSFCRMRQVEAMAWSSLRNMSPKPRTSSSRRPVGPTRPKGPRRAGAGHKAPAARCRGPNGREQLGRLGLFPEEADAKGHERADRRADDGPHNRDHTARNGPRRDAANHAAPAAVAPNSPPATAPPKAPAVTLAPVPVHPACVKP